MDVNNKTLAVLLIAGMVLSVGGVLTVLNSGMTGYGTSDTQYGTIDYNISSNVVLDFTVDAVDFGTGYVNTTDGSTTQCSIYTSGTANDAKCVTFDNPPPFALSNIGNKDVELNLSFAEDITDFLSNPSSDLQLKVTGSGCTAIAAPFQGFYSIDGNYDNGGEAMACANFNYDGTNNVGIEVNLTLNASEAGNDQITLSAIGTDLS